MKKLYKAPGNRRVRHATRQALKDPVTGTEDDEKRLLEAKGVLDTFDIW